MTALDWILSVVGLASLITFMGTIAIFVPEPALLAVIAPGVLLAIYDFWIRPLRKRNGGV